MEWGLKSTFTLGNKNSMVICSNFYSELLDDMNNGWKPVKLKESKRCGDSLVEIKGGDDNQFAAGQNFAEWGIHTNTNTEI